MNRKNNQVLIAAITRELALANSFILRGNYHSDFHHLERSHVRSQASQIAPHFNKI